MAHNNIENANQKPETPKDSAEGAALKNAEKEEVKTELGDEAEKGIETQLETRRNKFFERIEQQHPGKLKIIKQFASLTKEISVTTNSEEEIMKQSVFDTHVENWWDNKEHYEQCNLIDYITTYKHPQSEETILFIPTIKNNKLHLDYVSETTHRTRKSAPLSKNGTKLPAVIDFRIDTSTYQFHTSTDQAEIVRTGAGDTTNVKKEIEEGIKKDIENNNYVEAAQKIVSKLLSVFWSDNESKKEKNIDEYYNLGPLFSEVDDLDSNELRTRLQSLEAQIANTTNRQTKIRLTRCLGIIKDQIDDPQHNERPTQRLAEEAAIGDCLLINKNNEQVSGVTARLGENLLESYEPGYSFTHIAMITGKTPLEISHSTSNGFQTETVDDYAAKHNFDAMVLQTNAQQSVKERMGQHAKELVTAFKGDKDITYDTKAVRMDTIGLSSLNNLIDGNKSFNCGEFISHVMAGTANEFNILQNEPIPNEFIDKGENIFKPTYATRIA